MLLMEMASGRKNLNAGVDHTSQFKEGNEMNPNERPTMSRVKEMLEGDVESLQMPPKPFICPQEKPVNDEGVKADSRYSTVASCPDDSEEISQIIESS
ncbi:hypothetical protein FEM48_Zijuj05G0180700 [Ziziphus jujuba var. spinosa]|uniref:Uncharacterized protein n=1 Tax=Ziziphus jujuba var. spinosa TaxID=714518 RepID=A0A978VGB6_ZIZJJ|nr:hypothetical protein FEM48_Zijuj05G0180700 [Ziziphus jujuba var. spinosa]